VARDFNHFLARVRVRGGEPSDQYFVYRVAFFIQQFSEIHRACADFVPECRDNTKNFERLCAGKTDNADACAASSGGNGGNGAMEVQDPILRCVSPSVQRGGRGPPGLRSRSPGRPPTGRLPGLRSSNPRSPGGPLRIILGGMASDSGSDGIPAG